VVTILLAHHCGYIWLVKQRQFSERAAPTAMLVEAAEDQHGPVEIGCFPYHRSIAQYALELHHGGRVFPVFGSGLDLCSGAPVHRSIFDPKQ
jgi:hypothetical protein